MAYIKTTWVNDETELNAENFNHIEDGVEKAYGQLLLAVDSTAPAECTTGDRYYNTETNKIYTAIGTDTWGTTGEDAEEGVFYVVLLTQNIYTYNGTTLISVGGGAGSSTPIGVVEAYAGDTAPDGYLLCDGSAISRTIYKDLFETIGTTYGSGDGSTTFNIPNIKGKVVVMLDSTQTEFDTLGETGGSKTDYLTNAYAKIGRSSADYANIAYKSKGVGTGSFDRSTQDVGGLSGSSTTITEGTELGGSVSSLQPYIVLNYIIKAIKITPTTASTTGEYSTSTIDAYTCDYLNAVSLYSDTTGTNGDVSLSDNPTNYKILFIKHKNSDSGIKWVQTIINPTIGEVYSINRVEVTSNSVFLFEKDYTIASNKLTAGTAQLYDINGTHSTYNNIRVLEVIGYK